MTRMLCWVTFHIQIHRSGQMKNWGSLLTTRTESVNSSLYESKVRQFKKLQPSLKV